MLEGSLRLAKFVIVISAACSCNLLCNRCLVLRYLCNSVLCYLVSRMCFAADSITF